MMTLTYKIETGLYLNLTNKCPCNCTFCIRNNGDSAYGSMPLWLEHDPTAEEMMDALKKLDLNSYDEVVICGYGEPTEALDVLLETCKYIKSVSNTPIRLNTNGLSDLINKKPTAHLFEHLVDIMSVSLNSGVKENYMAVTRPCFGEIAFGAMQDFAVECKKYVETVIVSVVDVIGKEEIEIAKELANKLGLTLRVREYEE